MHKKIREIEFSDYAAGRFKSKLLESAYILGIGEIDDGQLTALFEFITDNFSDFSLAEINRAFSMNAAGKFIIKVEHYGKFSLPYVGAILSEYKKYRSKEIVQDANKWERIGEQRPFREIEKDDYDKIIAYIVLEKKMPDWGPIQFNHAYLYAVDQGYITFSPEEKKELAKKVKTAAYLELSEQELSFEKRAQRKKELENRLNNKIIFMKMCREFAIKEFFTEKFGL